MRKEIIKYKKTSTNIVLYNEDCLTALKDLPDSSVDFIITSPPYARQRKGTYGGVNEKEYVEWFLSISSELFRVLKDDGTFILNIKENVKNGERSTYVLELILALRKQGWLWTEEFIWNKKNSFPGKWNNRFRDGWERLLHFNKNRKFNMYQDEVKVPIGDWAKTRLKNLSDKDKQRDSSQVGSGFGKNVSNWVGKTTVYPNNVLTFATESSNKNHSAVYPLALPEWFIKLFSKEGDTVLDPFLGSGTTSIAAAKLGRHSIGIEILEEYYETAKNRINKDLGLV
jgi:site-specific DNA-methyltransferase (adenine-specific)